MSITGTTISPPIIITNTPFIQSGVTSGSASSITITDENGISVTNCFGLTTEVNEFSTTGETCNNVLEIVITEGAVDELLCDYIASELESSGLVLLTYADNSTTLNVHPECCNLIGDGGYTSEIGNEGYYVCRWREMFDTTDCNNYTPTSTFDENDYTIFDISTGGTTTIVPSAQCCYINGLVDDLTTEGVKCKEPVIPVCDGYVVEASYPGFGDVEFTFNGSTTTVVPTAECCTINGFSSREVDGGYTCYNASNPVKPTVQITLDSECCEVEEVNAPEAINNESVPTNFDGEYYRYVLTPCNRTLPIIRVKSSTIITDLNNVYTVLGSGGVGYDGKLSYPDTDLSPTSWYLGFSTGTECPTDGGIIR